VAEPTLRRRKSPASARTDRAPPTEIACRTALQLIARSCLADFKRHGRAAGDGDADALHRMRIALTRLRTAIRFFAPAVDDPAWTNLQQQAAWLSRQSGQARDIDVALARQRTKGAAGWSAKPWRDRRDGLYRRLRRTLHSAQYRRFINALERQSHFANGGAFSSGGDQSSLRRFSTRRLARWRDKLLTKARKLDRLGTRKRHKLRIRAKRFRYAMEWALPHLKEERTGLRKQIAQAKLIQDALGKLNDASTHRAHARALKLDPLPSMLRLGRQKSQQRLLKTARRGFADLRRMHEP
jgi:CHAD domain-containing protein